MNKLALGTVQFGLDYGISNESGKVTDRELDCILKVAAESDIRILDSAHIYGDSEIRLGYILPANPEPFHIISKLPAEAEKVLPYFEESLYHLKRKHLYAYMFHRFDTWGKKPELWDEMKSLKLAGKVDRIGFSLYKPEELEKIFDADLAIDIVQIPYSIFDRRFERLFDELKSRKVEIHVRSVFLQGLYFCKPDTLDSFFEPVIPKLRVLQEVAKVSLIPLSSIAMGFVHCREAIDKMVIGVSCCNDLKENLKYLDELEKVQALMPALDKLMVEEEEVLLPYLWPK